MEVRQLRSGLLLAEETAAPQAIREALKQIHPDLILGQDIDHAWSKWVWKVLLRNGDYPAIWLFDWRTDLQDPRSEPRSLSFGIVEEAKLRQLWSRRPAPDPLKANDELVAQLDRASEAEAHEIAAEASRRRGRHPVVHRSQGLRMARDKARARGEKA